MEHITRGLRGGREEETTLRSPRCCAGTADRLARQQVAKLGCWRVFDIHGPRTPKAPLPAAGTKILGIFDHLSAKRSAKGAQKVQKRPKFLRLRRAGGPSAGPAYPLAVQLLPPGLGPWRLRFRNHHARVSRRPMPQCLTLDPALVDCREKRTERGSGANPRNPIVEDMLEVVTRVK